MIDVGYIIFKFKVGMSIEVDCEKFVVVCEVFGYDKGYQIMIDVNQVWSVLEVIEYMKYFVEFKFVFIEELMNFDDVFGYVMIRKVFVFYGVGVVIGEVVQNCVIFK